MGNYISDHDELIAKKIANVMCGGDLSISNRSFRTISIGSGKRSFPLFVWRKENTGKNSGYPEWTKTFEKLKKLSNYHGRIYSSRLIDQQSGKAKRGGFRFTRPDDLAADVIKYLVKST